MNKKIRYTIIFLVLASLCLMATQSWSYFGKFAPIYGMHEVSPNGE